MKNLLWYIGVGAVAGIGGVLFYKKLISPTQAGSAGAGAPKAVPETSPANAAESIYTDKVEQLNGQATLILNTDRGSAAFQPLVAAFKVQSYALGNAALSDAVAGKISQNYYSYVQGTINQLNKQIDDYMSVRPQLLIQRGIVV